MERYIESISELNLGRRISGGSCSDIHELSDGVYFKKFNEDYCDLSDPINIEFYETIKFLSEINGMPFVVRGQDLYRSMMDFFGYSMPVVEAEQFGCVDDSVLVDDILSSVGRLSSDIRVLADNHVKTEDIGGDNILYNGDMYLLDLDLSLVDKRYVPDELYERTLHSVLCAVRGKMLGDERYKDVVKDGDYLSYFDRLKELCSEEYGSDIKTIGEFRRAYQKRKRYFN